MWKNPRFYLYLSVALTFFPGFSFAQSGFDSWLSQFREEALQNGISSHVVQGALTNITPLERVIELDRKQPEGTQTFAQYKARVINENRVEEGRRLYREHRDLLERIAAQYGVPAAYIVALWGIETSYGANTGGFDVVPALATLAYDGRRSSFFRGELLHALRILDEGHIDLVQMKGSWAGAMGQNQFMPSSFFKFAVDGNGDGRRDIWASLPDVFASTANYLSASGWKHDERWGREVILPEGFPESLTGLESRRSLTAWRNMGVTLSDGALLPTAGIMDASIVAPDGVGGPAFLVYDNYRVIKKWNNSNYFATCVGLLADRIAQP